MSHLVGKISREEDSHIRESNYERLFRKADLKKFY